MFKKYISIVLAFGVLVLSEQTMFAAVTTDNIKYGTSTAITITLNSLAASTSACRQSTVIDNSSSNLFIDDYVTIISSTSNSSLGSSNSIIVYVAGSEDGTNYDSDDVNIGASDAAYTVKSPTNLKIASVINALTSGKTEVRTFSVAQLYGGILPRKFAIVVCNDTNQSLASSGNSASYTGITYTNQ